MARTGNTTLQLPPFAGATRQLIVVSVVIFFADAILSLVLPRDLYGAIYRHLVLQPPGVLHGQIWQLVTYAFLPLGILGTLFAMLTIWFVGSMLEEVRGSRWLYELFFTSAIAGALLACAIAYTGLFHMDPAHAAGIGPSAGIYGFLIALAILLGDVEFFLLFIIRIKAKYLVAIYILIDIATLLKASNAFQALLHLSGALLGFLYLRYAPRRGYGFSATERVFALRNSYYRSRRRNAAKKFEVYMRGQNREVHFDKNGRYVDPDEKDPTDKRWMN